MAKKSTNSDERFQKQDFDLFEALLALDKKDYDYYSRLTEEQQRKFVPYMLVQWISAVKTGTQISSYHVLSTEHNANKHLLNEYVSKHPELQWHMLCAVSPGMGRQFHQWIPNLSPRIASLRESAKKKEVQEYFAKIYPGVNNQQLAEYSEQWTQVQNKKHALAQMYPSMKLDDIAVLEQYVTEQDFKDYDEHSGNI